MLKLLRRRSFRKSKDFKAEGGGRRKEHQGSPGSSEEANNTGHYSSKHLATDSQLSFSYSYAAATNNSWDRRSQGSGYHRYSSFSVEQSQAGGTSSVGKDSPPEILQYARPPENLTSPNRESNGLLHESLTPSPSLLRKTQQEEEERRRRQQQQQKPVTSAKSGGGGSGGSGGSGGGGVLSSLRQSFRRKGRRKSEGSAPRSTPVTQLPQRRASSGSHHATGSRSHHQGQHPTATSSITSATRQLLPGRASSPGRPVQVVTPFHHQRFVQNPEKQPQLCQEQQPATPQAQRVKESKNETSNMRDPVMASAVTTSYTSSKKSTGGFNAPPTAPARRLPQTPKQASRTGLTNNNSSNNNNNNNNSSSSSAANRTVPSHHQYRHTAVVSPVAASSASASAPRPAQRLSLRNKVGKKCWRLLLIHCESFSPAPVVWSVKDI